MTVQFACEIIDTPEATCISCPEMPAIPSTPTVVNRDPQHGWNSSARSSATHSGDCYTEFSAPPAAGLVCGFAKDYLPPDPITVTHGFYLFQRNGRSMYQIIERGTARLAAPVTRDPANDRYRIERIGTDVRYLVNDVEVYQSARASNGALMVAAFMYAAGDGVY